MRFRWFVSVILLLGLLGVGVAKAGAVEKFTAVYATTGAGLTNHGTGKPRAEAVRWWYSETDRVYYLFMPSNTQTLRLWLEGAEQGTLDGQPFVSGEEASRLLQSGTHTLTVGKRAYSLRVLCSAGVPTLFITTESGSLTYIHHRKENKESGTLHLIDARGKNVYQGDLAQIRGRGNATFVLNKKPYQIKLDKASDLLGMGKAKTWVLLAEFRDNSLLRNRLAFELAKAVGMPYTSQAQTVDVYINHDYLGAYTLCEKVEVGDTRVAIADLGKATKAINEAPLESYKRYGYNSYRVGTQKAFHIPTDPQDITGGYLLELDYKMRYSREASGFVTTKGQAVVVKEPELASQQQITYIASLMQGFENAIRASNGVDPKSGKHYSEFVDLQSLINKYVLEEVLKNRDANRSSLYFYKPADAVSSLAFMGPAWDYDAAMGNYASRANDKVLLPEFFCVNNDEGENFYFFPQLYAHEDFQAAAIAAYQSRFVPALEVLLGMRTDAAGTLQSIQAYADEIESCAAMNFTRWPVFNSKARIVKTGETYQENIDYLVRFFQGRLAFLNAVWQGK